MPRWDQADYLLYINDLKLGYRTANFHVIHIGGGCI